MVFHSIPFLVCLDVPIDERKCEEEYAACNTDEALSREITNLIENDVNRYLLKTNTFTFFSFFFLIFT